MTTETTTTRPPAPDHADVHAAQLAVMEEVPYIKKVESKGLNYTFMSEASLLRKLHKAMVRHKLVMHPCKVEAIDQSTYSTKNGGQMFRMRVKVDFELMHGPSKTSKVIQTIGEAADAGDKATAKALTIALKYGLKQAFLIETGDDPDKERHEAADSRRAADSGDTIERGRVALKKCKTLEHVRGLKAKFETVPDESQRSELMLLADRAIAEMEKQSTNVQA